MRQKNDLLKRYSLTVGHYHSTNGCADVVQDSSVPPTLSSGEQRTQNLVVVTGGIHRQEHLDTRVAILNQANLWESGVPLAISRPMP